MGYTHYYWQKPKLDKGAFLKISTDFKKMIPVFDPLVIKIGITVVKILRPYQFLVIVFGLNSVVIMVCFPHLLHLGFTIRVAIIL